MFLTTIQTILRPNRTALPIVRGDSRDKNFLGRSRDLYFLGRGRDIDCRATLSILSLYNHLHCRFNISFCFRN